MLLRLLCTEPDCPSLWKVDDEATAILMKALYPPIQQGEKPKSGPAQRPT
jgi:hypothetical protein